MTAYYSARIARAYRSLALYSVVELSKKLASIEKAQELHALRCCNGDYFKVVQRETGGTWFDRVHNPVAQQRADERIGRRLTRWVDRLRELLKNVNTCRCGGKLDADRKCGNIRCWAFNETQNGLPKIERSYDPRGFCLTVVFPGEIE